MCHIDFWSGELGQTSKRCILRSRQCLPQTGRKFSFRYCRDIFSNVVSYKEAAKAAKKDLHLKFLFPPVLSKDRGGSFPGWGVIFLSRCELFICSIHLQPPLSKLFPPPRNVITFGHNYPTTQCISLIFNDKKIYDNKKRFCCVRGDNMFHVLEIVDLRAKVSLSLSNHIFDRSSIKKHLKKKKH